MINFDFHIEFLIIPAYLLAFYFYTTLHKRLFVASLLLMLGSMEAAPIIALALGLGLAVYELRRKTDREE